MLERRSEKNPTSHRRTRRPRLVSEVKAWHQTDEVVSGANPEVEEDSIIPLGFEGKVVWTRKGLERVVIVVKELGKNPDNKRVLQVTDPQGNIIEGGARREDLYPYVIAKPGKKEPPALDPSDPRYRDYSYKDKSDKDKRE